MVLEANTGRGKVLVPRNPPKVSVYLFAGTILAVGLCIAAEILIMNVIFKP
jgi:hypothetical protein